MIGEGETVVTRWTCRGTHKGDLSGIAPTGKQITISGITVGRFAHGKIAQGYANWDALGLMQQLGVVPQLAAKVQAAAPRQPSSLSPINRKPRPHAGPPFFAVPHW